eukprot:CAMPEP_0181320928 /NCGR_PEP_ID=MMETSP1101-20121128/18395_1 /TAXON_ID=46948 /ORGANISM="Rhodomonas abbreviata, Strain Caron Lab Isolate" /LENGTH=56 /DNA_ID=CAMNT_0023428685 /DNA_START=148 /DNA_END=318 /DNA_ORIENTATION=-
MTAVEALLHLSRSCEGHRADSKTLVCPDPLLQACDTASTTTSGFITTSVNAQSDTP